MRPGGRIQAAVELLDRIEHPEAGKAETPADTVVSGYFRGRRYIGGGDRRFVGDLVWGVLRNRARLDWRAGAALGPRGQAAAALRLLHHWSPAEIAAAFEDGPHAPGALEEAERAALDALDREPAEAEPLAVAANLPPWIADLLSEAFGADAEAEGRALAQPAAVDLRVNTLKTTPEAARQALEDAGIDASPTPMAPDGLRLDGRVPLGTLAAYREGAVEVQDEGSQIAAALVCPAPGMAVLDLCAGGGGKTLALAAAMRDRGRILAMDVDPRRLGALAKRARAAGVSIVETRAGDAREAGETETFDRVLADVPCSGSGAWRRHPETSWRLTPERLDELASLQGALLRRAADRVARGGRLAYVTCSLFPVENERQVEAFLAARPDFRILSVASLWDGVLEGSCPASGDALLLTPCRSGTDGFFVAILERRQ